VHGEFDALGDAGRGVTVAVAAEHGDLTLGDVFQRVRVQPGALLRCVPRAELAAALSVPDPDEQQVAGADAHLLRVSGPREVVGGDQITGLKPGDSVQSRDVEQDAALGNFPQAFSHLSLINAAINLDYQLDHGAGDLDNVLDTR
jgi:hypothetical protein